MCQTCKSWNPSSKVTFFLKNKKIIVVHLSNMWLFQCKQRLRAMDSTKDAHVNKGQTSLAICWQMQIPEYWSLHALASQGILSQIGYRLHSTGWAHKNDIVKSIHQKIQVNFCFQPYPTILSSLQSIKSTGTFFHW